MYVKCNTGLKWVKRSFSLKTLLETRVTWKSVFYLKKYLIKNTLGNTANLKMSYAKDVWETFIKLLYELLRLNPCLIGKEDAITDVFL